MKRTWITALALAGVAGSAGAAFAGIAAGDTPHTAPAQPDTIDQSQARAQAQAGHKIVSYQVGAAGTVQLTADDGVLTVSGVTAAGGWMVLGANGPGSHVDVQFSDTLQIVTFSADWVNGDIAVSLRSDAAAGAPSSTAAQAPIGITIITVGDPTSRPGTTAPHPQPATPPTTPAPSTPHTTQPTPHTTQPAPATTQPAPATTTAPSGTEPGEPDDD